MANNIRKAEGLILDKFIFVTDLHVTKTNLEESRRFILWLKGIQEQTGLTILFGGDQYHEFGIARVEAVHFWHWAYSQIKDSISLVGNHDMNQDGSLTFMTGHNKETLVIDVATYLSNGVLLLPFYRKKEDFIEAINLSPVSRIICHQEFNGCQYENGFYSPYGADPADIPECVEQVISGHIHKTQSFGKVFYPGNPRHLTKSDIGDKRGITIFDLTSGTHEFMETPHEVCAPFILIELIEGQCDLKTTKIPESPKVYVDIRGSSKFVKAVLKQIPDGTKVRSFPESESSEVVVKESEGIQKAFFRYSIDYFNKNKIGNEEAKVILSKIYDTIPSLKQGVE